MLAFSLHGYNLVTRQPHVAILVNGNAKRVNSDVVEALHELGGLDLFVSRSIEEAQTVARRVVEQGYDTVLIGGGDGTFVEWTSQIIAQAEAAGTVVPRFSLLPLGTGNALATALGLGEATLWELRRSVRHARASTAERPLDLLEVEGRLTPFAGFGLDAIVLEDHQTVENRLRSIGLDISANAGYALSIALRSIPRFAVTDYPEVTITNLGAAAVALDEDGQPSGDTILAGEVLYRGRASIASCSTIPYFGLQLKLFPHIEKHRDCFQLRVSDAGLLEVLGHLPALWRGTYASASIHDYLCTAVLLESSPESPFQVGGDVIGRRERVVVELATRRLRVLS